MSDAKIGNFMKDHVETDDNTLRFDFMSGDAKAKRMCEITELDESYKFATGYQNPLFDGNYFAHQAVALEALKDCERKRFIRVPAPSESYEKITNHPLIIESNSMAIGDKFGTGKTAIVISMIIDNKLPVNPNKPRCPYYINKSQSNFKRHAAKEFKQFQHSIKFRFNPESVIAPNFVFVGKSVVHQWEQAFEKFYPESTVMVVANYYDFKNKFYPAVINNTINSYDAIICKNDTITGDLSFFGSNLKSQTMLNAMSGVFYRNKKVLSRVFYDDFDTIGVARHTRQLPALTTVYVSATRKNDKTFSFSKSEKHTTRELLASRTSGYLVNIARDCNLFGPFMIRSSEEFSDASTSVTKVKCHKYVYKNPDDQFIGLIGALGDLDAADVAQMLNGDAVETAAQLIGVASFSVADIFRKMLGDRYDRFIKLGITIEETNRLGSRYVKAQKISPKTKYDKKYAKYFSEEEFKKFQLRPMNRGANEYTIAEFNLIKKAINEKVVTNDKGVTIHPVDRIELRISNILMRNLKELRNNFQAEHESLRVGIDRVKSNILTGSCQICNRSLEDESTFIVKCCGIILCGDCGSRGTRTKLQKNYTNDGTGAKLMGKCPNCSASVNFKENMIYLAPGFDIELLLNATGNEEKDVIKRPDAPEEEVDEDPEYDPFYETIENVKHKALYRIIKGKVPEEHKSVNLKIPGLMIGKKDKERTSDIPTKVLAFAGYDESLRKTAEFLDSCSIKYHKLGGTPKQMAETVRDFERDDSKVLLVNSGKHCAGLNIQFATDLVFMHKITSVEVEAQVAGRAQRVGRKCNLNIHYLLYRNEKVVEVS